MIDLTKGKDSIYPFSFTEIDKVFDDETFKKLNEEWPQKYRQTVMGGRNQMSNSNKNFIQEEFEKWLVNSPTWKKVYNLLNTDETYKALIKHHKQAIDQWDTSFDDYDLEPENLKGKLYLHIDWSSAENNYKREVHADIPRRIINFLIFFNDKDWEGGDFIVHSSDKIHNFIWNKENKDHFPVHKVVEAKANTAFVFASTPNSFHSVSKQAITKTPRRFIYGAYTLTKGLAYKNDRPKRYLDETRGV